MALAAVPLALAGCGNATTNVLGGGFQNDPWGIDPTYGSPGDAGRTPAPGEAGAPPGAPTGPAADAGGPTPDASGAAHDAASPDAAAAEPAQS
jgi:hypothetical protein